MSDTDISVTDIRCQGFFESLEPALLASPSFPEESGRRLFCGVAAWAEELGRERTTDAHQQRRRRVSADAAGTGGTLRFGTFGEDSVQGSAFSSRTYGSLGSESIKYESRIARRQRRNSRSAGPGARLEFPW